MLQRVQTIFLLLASLGALLDLAFPFATLTSGADASHFQLLADRIFDVKDQPVLLYWSVAMAALAALTIFLFRNRPLQMRICYFVAFAAMGLLGWVAYLYVQENALGTGVNPAAGLAEPVLTAVFALLASFFIRKDERLIKSMDRLR